jgi:hypothetical protein
MGFHRLQKRFYVDAAAGDGDTLTDGNARAGQERGGSGRHHARQVVARESKHAIVRARRQNERPRPNDERLVGAGEQGFPFVNAEGRRPSMEAKTAHIRDRLTARTKGTSGFETIVDDEDADTHPLVGDLAGHGESCRPTPHHQHIHLFARRSTRRSHVVRQGSHPRQVAGDLLHDGGCRRYSGQQMMVIDALGEKPVGHLQKVHSPRTEHVLRTQRFAASAGDQAGHHVRFAVHARHAPVAAAP